MPAWYDVLQRDRRPFVDVLIVNKDVCTSWGRINNKGAVTLDETLLAVIPVSRRVKNQQWRRYTEQQHK